MLTALLIVWTCLSIGRCSAPDPQLPAGGHLQIDLMKQNSSELSTTVLNEPKIALFTGDAPMPSESGIIGELVPFSPLDGCRPLEFNSQFHTNSTQGAFEFKSFNNSTNFVVIMKKGKCSYATMIEHASKVHHVVGVLVYDPNSSGFASLQVYSPDDLVPSFYISSTLGEDLLKKVNKYRDSDDNPWVRVTLSYTPVRIDMAKGLQIFLIVVTISLVLSLIISMVWNYRIRNSLPAFEDTPQPPPRRRPEQIPIDEEFLAKIPRRSYRSPNTSPVEFSPKSADINYDGTLFDDHDDDYRQRVPHNETCPICLDEFMYGTEINQLHCGHCYHPKCILPWLQNRSPLCPLCKIDVRVSLIEAEELAFVRSLRKLQRAKSTTAIEQALIKKMVVTNEGGHSAGSNEMKEVFVVSAGSSMASLRARNASFESIPLEAAASGNATPNRRHTDLT